MPEAPAPALHPGTLEAALANGRKLLRDHPETALAQAHAILKRDGANVEALRLAAAAHRARGEDQEAVAAELASIHHSPRLPAIAAATRALDAGNPGEASRIAAEHLRAHPDDLAAISLSAESALAFGFAGKAEALLRRVLERVPPLVPARLLLADALMRQDRLVESGAEVDRALGFSPENPAALRLRARIETELGDHDAAARTYEQLLPSGGEEPELWVLYGDALRFLGRKSDSRLAYARALAIEPTHGQAWWSLVNLDPAGTDDATIAELEAALAARADHRGHAASLHFALGAAFDATGRHAEAFHHIEAGNALRRASQPYDRAEISGQVDRYIAALTPGSIAPRADTAGGPIFIIGMPRSGSTLVERILGRHSQIEALGELAVVPHIVEGLKLQNPEGLEARIAALPSAQLEALAERYRTRAAEHRRTERPFFIDKLHMNWRHLALILRMLPEARVIDVRRDPLDCCWSNYKLLFARGHPAAADMGDLGAFFTDYVRFLDHIETIAPGRVHRVDYEALVDDIEGETWKLLDHIGVSAERQCLDFHLSDAPVATASSEQVRKPLNREGVGAWKPYAEWLGPLKNALP
jgi:tetratricopeptide (TPR) repeat protein